MAGKESGIKTIFYCRGFAKFVFDVNVAILNTKYFDKSQAEHLKVRDMPAEGSQHTSEMLWDDFSPAVQFTFGA